MSIAISNTATVSYGIPATEAEIAKLPVIINLRLDRATLDKIKRLATAQKSTQQGLLRHLVTTHPNMQEAPCK